MRETWLKSKEGDQNRCAVLRATKKVRKIGPFLDFRGRTCAPEKGPIAVVALSLSGGNRQYASVRSKQLKLRSTACVPAQKLCTIRTTAHVQAAPAGDDDYDEFINFWTVMNISRVVYARPGSNRRRAIRIDALYCGLPKKV